jgi:hypothetical protein
MPRMRAVAMNSPASQKVRVGANVRTYDTKTLRNARPA